ncbi:MAG: vitamin K epoxide reductase family protein [Chloroflexi bacterium]|nr:vitamin K epoxide reductase family protein [Chloroflexota bacterium]
MTVKAMEEKEKRQIAPAVWLRRASAALAGLGLLVSLYLTWVKLANTSAFCGGVGDCESVNASRFSVIGGIPIALLGAGAYAAMLALHFMEGRGQFWRQWSPVGVFGLALFGTLYSAYLTYIELAVLHAVCPYCVVSAIAITLILVISVVRLWRPDTDS